MKQVAQAVYARIKAATGLPKIYWENIDDINPVGEHIVVSMLQLDSGQEFLGTTQQGNYLLNVNIGVKRGVGQIKAMDIGQKLIELFPKNLVISASAPLISVDLAPKYGVGYYDEKWYRLPLRIYINSI